MPVTAVGRKGSAAGEYRYPGAITHNESTHQLFITDYSNKSVVVCTETGE